MEQNRRTFVTVNIHADTSKAQAHLAELRRRIHSPHRLRVLRAAEERRRLAHDRACALREAGELELAAFWVRVRDHWAGLATRNYACGGGTSPSVAAAMVRTGNAARGASRALLGLSAVLGGHREGVAL